MLKITGYSDRVSARPGETIKFMVNCELGEYRADIVKLICGDSSPDGPDFKEELIRTPANKRYKGAQAAHLCRLLRHRREQSGA